MEQPKADLERVFIAAPDGTVTYYWVEKKESK